MSLGSDRQNELWQWEGEGRFGRGPVDLTIGGLGASFPLELGLCPFGRWTGNRFTIREPQPIAQSSFADLCLRWRTQCVVNEIPRFIHFTIQLRS